MSLPLIVTADAEADIADAKRWYATRHKGLDLKFVRCVERGLDRIRQLPGIGRMVHRGVRRLVLQQFPYGIFYRVSDDHIAILAVYHSRREPRGWQNRM